jgi:hypothetical protein
LVTCLKAVIAKTISKGAKLAYGLVGGDGKINFRFEDFI